MTSPGDCKLQVKLMSYNKEILRTAAEQFLGKEVQEIEDTIIQVNYIKPPLEAFIKLGK